MILVENMDETNLPLPFVKLFGMTSGASVRGTVDLILMRNIFNYFNFYSIDRLEKARNQRNIHNQYTIIKMGRFLIVEPA